MNLKKAVSILCVLALALSLFGCSADNQTTSASESAGDTQTSSATESTAEESTEITVTDMMGREVTLPDTPERIVSLLASDVEILYALGAQDQIVGVGEYCNYPPEAMEEKTVVATGNETNLEQILALDPDLVIIGAMAQDTEQAEQIEAAGIPAIMTNANNISQAYENISLLGKVSGKEAAAEQLISDMKADFAEIQEITSKEAEKKSIYFEISPLEYGLWTAGNNTFMQELCDIVNLENIFSDVEGWAEVSEEQVIERNPDYIATVTMYYGEGPTPDEEILGRAGWQEITAVKEKQVLCADNDSLTRPGPRLVDAAKKLAEFVYGVEIS